MEEIPAFTAAATSDEGLPLAIILREHFMGDSNKYTKNHDTFINIKVSIKKNINLVHFNYLDRKKYCSISFNIKNQADLILT